MRGISTVQHAVARHNVATLDVLPDGFESPQYLAVGVAAAVAISAAGYLGDLKLRRSHEEDLDRISDIDMNTRGQMSNVQRKERSRLGTAIGAASLVAFGLIANLANPYTVEPQTDPSERVGIVAMGGIPSLAGSMPNIYGEDNYIIASALDGVIAEGGVFDTSQVPVDIYAGFGTTVNLRLEGDADSRRTQAESTLQDEIFTRDNLSVIDDTPNFGAALAATAETSHSVILNPLPGETAGQDATDELVEYVLTRQQLGDDNNTLLINLGIPGEGVYGGTTYTVGGSIEHPQIVTARATSAAEVSDVINEFVETRVNKEPVREPFTATSTIGIVGLVFMAGMNLYDRAIRPFRRRRQ
ncbi:MAG: hypothetical protein AAF413_01385 [Patescibacteria group bacterium]